MKGKRSATVTGGSYVQEAFATANANYNTMTMVSRWVENELPRTSSSGSRLESPLRCPVTDWRGQVTAPFSRYL